MVVHPEVMCTRAGTEEPNAVINIWSINVFNKENNPVFGEKLVKFFSAELPAVPQNRLTVKHSVLHFKQKIIMRFQSMFGKL